LFEWYRYDALSRRVLVRTRRDHTCGWECSSEITRYVWDGDQILLEIQAPGGDVNTLELENDNGSGSRAGRVVYTHGPGIDRPLDVIRTGFWGLPSHWGGPILILPVANWRGTLIGGTDARGRQLPCHRNVYDCEVPFPGTVYTTFYESNGETARMNWFGSLIAQKQDANGLFYMRNRYYNPHTGTFTQEDPIGIAGGLNLYGYAGGDPINFSDPFGLCAMHLRDSKDLCPGGLSEGQYNSIEASIRDGIADGSARERLFGMLEGGSIRLARRTGNGQPAGANWRRGRILVTSQFFTSDRPQGGNGTGYGTSHERAWVLAHELGHIIQAEEGRLISETGSGMQPNRRRMRGLLSEWGEHAPAQVDANAYACSVARNPGAWGTKPGC
jgi:RHS repeat-associated protein